MSSEIKKVIMYLLLIIVSVLYIADQIVIFDSNNNLVDYISIGSIEAGIDRSDLVVEVERANKPEHITFGWDGYTLTEVSINKILKADNDRSVSNGDVITIKEPYKLIDRGLFRIGKLRSAYGDYTPINKDSKYILLLVWSSKYNCYEINTLHEGKYNIDDTDKKEMEMVKNNIRYESLKNELLSFYSLIR